MNRLSYKLLYTIILYSIIIGYSISNYIVYGYDISKKNMIYSDSDIANAIYKAENSIKYPYGIKSIDTHGDKEYARKICLNTIHNQRIRHSKHNCHKDFITCLGNRYCPPKVHKLNGNWVRNVKYHLERAISRY